MRKHNISLSRELDLAVAALDGAKLLAEQWADDHFNAEDHRRVVRTLAAMLVVVRERLRLLDRVVRDGEDPCVLSMAENEALDTLPGDDGDVVLEAWPPRKRAAKSREEAEQAERKIEVREERRREKRVCGRG